MNFLKLSTLFTHEKHRFTGAAEHICHFGIRIHKSLTYIRDKNDDIRRINGDLCLFPI